MSRLIVKNLPGETTEGDLLRLFSQKGALTEVDIKRNSQGRSRKFAFIGYHDDRNADEAIRAFNHTFIKTNKIQVERCLYLSAAEKSGRPRPVKKFPQKIRPIGPISKTQTKRAEKKLKKRLGIVSTKQYPKKSNTLGIPVVQEILLEKYQTDPDFAAFLDLRSPEQAAKCREMLNLPKRDNDDVDSDVNIDFPEKQQRLKRREVINLLFHVKLKSLPKKTNKTLIKEFFHPLKCVSIRQPKHAFSVAFVGFMHEHERRRALEKDKSYLNGKSIRVIEYNDDYKRKKIIDVGPPSFRIYFYDLPPSYTPEEIERIFSAHGKLKSIVMPRYASSNKLKGYGLVTYEDKEDALRAFEKLSDSPLKDIIVLSPEQTSRVTTGKLEECGFLLEGTLKRSSETEEDSDEDEPKKKRWKNQEDSLKNEESVAESGRIFIRNLSYTTQEADIEKLFATYGPITEINLPIDSETKQIKGYGIVTFLMPEHAVRAFTELDGTILHGRMLHLIPGKSKDTPDLEESSNFKEKKLNKQKAEAGKAHNWNALFVDHNAVAEVVADKFGTSKEAILGPEIKGSAAVRLALAETQIVNETKKYLEEMGVRLDAFNESKNKKRSKTTILVKNLPSKTEPKELRGIFQKHGQIARLILPPNGLTAIIEYLDPSEARKAFVSLAYSKFKHLPLYLEWAPEGSLDNVAPKTESVKPEETTEDDSNMKQQGENHDDEVEGANKVVENEVTQTKSSYKVPEGNPEPGTTLFVKNINFQTRNDALRTHFEQIGPLHYAYVVTKKGGSSKDAPELSRGYGFVRYMLKSDADRALEQLQQSVLDEKSLELARSDRSERDDGEEKQNTDKKSKVKLIVKNIPFAAKNKEVGEIFSTFGGLKRLKLPKKVGAEANRHRGYAFVEFTNESDAKAAYEALHLSTHLLGRRLVLEWAKDDEDIDEIRKKTEEHYAPQKKAESKKSVFKIE